MRLQIGRNEVIPLNYCVVQAMKKIVMVVGALSLAMLIALFAAGYHDQRDFPTANAITLPPGAPGLPSSAIEFRKSF